MVPKTSKAGESQADLSSCGNIHVEASAQCELVAPGTECKAGCDDVSFKAACDAELDLDCEGPCEASASVDCDITDCQASCKADCEVDPGEFDCAASCNADCSASCEGKCEAEDDTASCQGKCEGSCSASCDAECDVELPSADCNAGCKASCNGSCTGEADFDCQIKCEAKAYAKCEADFKGECEVSCKTKDGALSCDGQYVDYGDNLDECVDALKAALNITVEGYAECKGNSCKGGFSCECSTAPGRTKELPGWAMISMTLGLAFIARRRMSGRT
jgi:hypothetical protein